MYTHVSALHIFSLQHKFLCSLAFIQAHLFPGRQAVYFLCTFNSKYTYVFPMGAYTHLPFPHVQGGIENSPPAPLSSHTPLYDISFFLSSIGRGHPILFFSNLLAKRRESRRIKLLLSLPSLLKGYAKIGLVSPEVTVKKLPTFPYC